MTLIDNVITAADNGLYVGAKQLTTFVPHILEVKKVLTSNGFQMSYSLSIIQNGVQIDTVIVSQLFISSWFALSGHCPDASLSRQSRKLIEEFLEKEAAKLPVHQEVLLNQYGWHHIDSGKLYFRKEIITSAVEVPVYSEKAMFHTIQAERYNLEITNCASFLEIIELVAVGTSWLLYLASYFDILKELFHRAGYQVQFILNVYGKSGSGKTSLVKTTCSPSQTFSFRSAKCRDTILREIAEYAGHTILVDDYHPAENNADRDRQAGLKDSLVRSIEEIPSLPNIIITSEYLDGHTSMQDREIQLFLDANLDWKLLELLGQHQKSLEKIRTAFYAQIVLHAEAVVNDIAEFCKNADSKRAASNQSNFRNARYGDYICCVNFLFQKYFINKYHINFRGPDIKADIISQLSRQTRHMQIAKNIEQQSSYLVILRDMLQSGEIFDQIPDYNEYIPSAYTIHINSQGIVFISPNALRRGMMIYLQTSHVPLKRIIKELQEAEALITYEDKSELTKKHHGKRIYVIDTDALTEYCSFLE